MTNAVTDTYKDACTERMIGSRLTGMFDELWRMVVKAERNAALAQLPGAEDDIERARRLGC
jgi:hypothetical protein